MIQLFNLKYKIVGIAGKVIYIRHTRSFLTDAEYIS